MVSPAPLCELNEVPHSPCLQLRSPQMQAVFSRWALFKDLRGLALWLFSIITVITPSSWLYRASGLTEHSDDIQNAGRTGLNKSRPFLCGVFTSLLCLKSLRCPRLAQSKKILIRIWVAGVLHQLGMNTVPVCYQPALPLSAGLTEC